MRSIIRFLSAAATLACAGTSLAHVFWIQPSTFSPSVGQVVGVKLRVGDTFPGDSLPRDDQRIVRFIALGPSFTEPASVVGRDGRDPAGIVRFTAAGVHVLAYQSTPTPVTLSAEKFEAYLTDKGLEEISRLRAQRGQTGQEAHEVYSRSVKSVLAVDGQHGAAGGFDAEAGIRFEMVPLSDPTALRAGASLRVRLLFEHKPLSGALIQARSPSAPTEVIRARSDQNGEAEIAIPSAGMWVIDAVQMKPAPPHAEGGAEWESVWASLAFSTADAPAVAGAAPAARAAEVRP